MFKYLPGMALLNFDAGIKPYDPQQFKGEHNSEIGKKMYEVITSRDGRLVIAMATFGRDPAAPYLGEFLATYVGPQCFTDRFKQYAGHLIKHVVECMGGQIDKRNVDIVIPNSRYTRATRYALTVPHQS